MASSYIGIDVGTDYVRLAVRDKGIRFVSRRLPDNAINDEGIVSPQVISEFLKKVREEEGIRTKTSSIVLAEGQAFFRHITMPAMTVSELMINLPYEFRDYITDDPTGYNFDYVIDEMVLDDDGQPERMELFAAAASKSYLDRTAQILKKAGMKLKVVNPAQMAYSILMDRYIAEHPDDAQKDVVLVNIDYGQTSIALFEGSHFQGSRVIELGGRDLDDAIADLKGVDRHVAGSYAAANFDQVLDSPECQAVYDRLVFEINKVINFYNFSNPDKDIQNIYILGGGAELTQLRDTMVDGLNYPVLSIAELLPSEVASQENSIPCALAYAALLAGEAM